MNSSMEVGGRGNGSVWPKALIYVRSNYVPLGIYLFLCGAHFRFVKYRLNEPMKRLNIQRAWGPLHIIAILLV